MSILFEENTKPTSKKPKRFQDISSMKGGLSSKAAPKIPPLFDNLFDAPARPAHDPSPKSSVQEDRDVLSDLLTSQAYVSEYAQITPLPGPPDAAVVRARQSAEESFRMLARFATDIVSTLEQIDNALTEERRRQLSKKPPDGADFRLRGLHAVKYAISEKCLRRHQKHVLRFQGIKQSLISLLEHVNTTRETRQVLLNIEKLYRDLRAFDTADLKLPVLKRRKARIASLIAAYPRPPAPIGRAIEEARQRFVPVTGFFVDTGWAEGVLQTAVFPGESIEKRLQMVLGNRDAIGRAVLASSTEFMRAREIGEDLLPIVFLLFVRYYFRRLYEIEMGKQIVLRDYTDIGARIAQFRQLSPAGFGITEAFLDEKCLTMPLAALPPDNIYRDAISIFEQLPYFLCPIDFCVAVHEGLKTLQNIASTRSFDYLLEKGKLSAKRDHLLCLDDLVDVFTVVFLLANPVPTIAIVLEFEPYIRGLEMTSELEFSFTNISAIVGHLLKLNIEEFMQAARRKAEAAMEVDPLLGK
jgi:hypothetical protein